MPCLVITGYIADGYFNFLTPVCCFVLVPLVDWLSFPKPSESKEITRDKSNTAYRWIPLLYVPVVLTLSICGSFIVATEDLSIVEVVGLVLSVGIVSGAIGFTLAHEFIHKFTFPERVSGYLLLANTNYLHYSIEHIYGHHVYACTEADPNSARKGESFYHFFPRSVAGTFLNAWTIECKRLFKKRHRVFSLHNRMILFLLIQLSIIMVVALAGGIMPVIFFLAQGFVAVVMLHQINYLQHYGLTRKFKREGVPERIDAHHSWGTLRPLMFDLFQLENHADHHLHPTHSYEKLIVHGESPTLPGNYASMMAALLVPPLWFKITHKRLSLLK